MKCAKICTIVCVLITIIFLSGQKIQRVPAAPSSVYKIKAVVKDIQVKETDFETRGVPRKDFVYYHLNLEIKSLAIHRNEGIIKLDKDRIEKEGCIIDKYDFDKNPIAIGQTIESLVHFAGDEWFHGLFIEDIDVIEGVAKADTVRIPTTLKYTFKPGKIEVTKDENDKEIFSIPDFGRINSPGDPMLPYRIYDVLLPPNIDWNSLQLKYRIKDSPVSGDFHIKPAPPRISPDGEFTEISWGLNKQIEDGRNKLVYGKDAWYPEKPIVLLSKQQLRKWKYVRIGFSPLKYNPVTGKVRLIKATDIELQFDRVGMRDYLKDPLLIDTVFTGYVQSEFFNYKDIYDWFGPVLPPGPKQLHYDYVIITTNTIVDSCQATINEFVNHKRTLGHDVYIVTEDDYGNLAGAFPHERAEQIRQWLQQHYTTFGIKWVLLIGDPDPVEPGDPADHIGDIPMKMTWPSYPSLLHIDFPTDYYYAELTGDWDLDDDGVYGEQTTLNDATSPEPGVIDSDSFSVRWTGKLRIDSVDYHYFVTTSDDGIRLILDGDTLINNWEGHEIAYDKYLWYIPPDTGFFDIVVEYYNLNNNGVVKVGWKSPDSRYIVRIYEDRLYHWDGDAYVSGGLNGEYFDNIDFTDHALTRVDSVIDFYWGTGDNGSGGVEFSQEVYVGRIPVYSAQYDTLSKILQKIIDYESAMIIPPYRRRALLPMKPSDAVSLGWDLGENIKDSCLVPAGLGYYRIYDEDYDLDPPPEATPCNIDNVVAAWDDGYGLVTWWGHGSSYKANSIIDSIGCKLLDDTKPSFTCQASCLNGCPEIPGNLGYRLLRHGAVGTISGTRTTGYTPGWWNWPPDPTDNTNQYLAYYCSKRLLGGQTVGSAMYDTKCLTTEWNNNMAYNLYGDPSTSLFKPYSPVDVDVVIVMDRSGSMHNYASEEQTDRKIDVLQNAAHHFVDLMEADGTHQLGLVQFNEEAQTVMHLQPHTSSSRYAAHQTIATINASGATSIGGGLHFALDEFDLRGNPDHRRVILLVTDGKENTEPWIEAVEGDIINHNATVYSLGLGYSSGVNAGKLASLAMHTGGDYRITNDEIIFRKYFIEMLCGAVYWDVAVDPVFTLSGQEMDSVAVPITALDNEVLFTAYWTKENNAVEFDLRAPSGTTYKSNSVHYTEKTRYSIYHFDLSEMKLEDRLGVWWMKVKSLSTDEQIRVSASAFVRSPVKERTYFTEPFLYVGESTVLTACLRDNGQPITDAKVVAYYNSPSQSYGNMMFENRDKIVTDQVFKIQGDTLMPVEIKSQFLRKELRGKFMRVKYDTIALYDDGKHKDGAVGDGIYACEYKPQIPGIYNFRIVASGKTEAGEFTREWTELMRCEVDVSKQHTHTDYKLVKKNVDGSSYLVTVVPKDKFGNFLGPGHDITILIPGLKGEQEIKLDDQATGIYSKEIFLSTKELKGKAQFLIKIDEERKGNFMIK
ncbi:MAG: C25 family cysteine peptidase [bacterium]